MRAANDQFSLAQSHFSGQSTSYYDSGRGVPLVLLHGIGSSGASFSGQLQELSCHNRVIAWNAPGYLDSVPLSQIAPLAADYAQRLAVLLEDIDVPSCFLLGHSLGALVAASFAKSWPERVHGLVFADPAQGYAQATDDVRTEKLSSRLNAFEELGVAAFAKSRAPNLLSKNAPSSLVQQVSELMSQLTDQGYRQAAMMLAHGDLKSDAEQYNGPILVLCGSEDSVTPPEGARDLARKLRSAEYRSIDGAGHASYVEQPGKFNELVLDFVTTHPVNNERT